MHKFLPLWQLLFSIGFLAVLEGLGVFVFTGVIAGTVREETRSDVEKELLKTRLLFLQAQLRPHFFFNALNTISALCGREGAAAAQRLVLKLSDFLRHTLEQKSEMVPLGDELGYVDSYIELEKARYQEHLNVVREVTVGEQALGHLIPLLLLQPLVENAIKHGIRNKPGGGTVRISVRQDGGDFLIEVSDDGPGKESGFFENYLKGFGPASEGTGIGLKNIHERLLKYYGKDRGLRFESSPGKGTSVKARVPAGIEGTP